MQGEEERRGGWEIGGRKEGRGISITSAPTRFWHSEKVRKGRRREKKTVITLVPFHQQEFHQQDALCPYGEKTAKEGPRGVSCAKNGLSFWLWARVPNQYIHNLIDKNNK